MIVLQPSAHKITGFTFSLFPFLKQNFNGVESINRVSVHSPKKQNKKKPSQSNYTFSTHPSTWDVLESEASTDD